MATVYVDFIKVAEYDAEKTGAPAAIIQADWKTLLILDEDPDEEDGYMIPIAAGRLLEDGDIEGWREDEGLPCPEWVHFMHEALDQIGEAKEKVREQQRAQQREEAEYQLSCPKGDHKTARKVLRELARS